MVGLEEVNSIYMYMHGSLLHTSHYTTWKHLRVAQLDLKNRRLIKDSSVFPAVRSCTFLVSNLYNLLLSFTTPFHPVQDKRLWLVVSNPIGSHDLIQTVVLNSAVFTSRNLLLENSSFSLR
jgi:hypothetical protein